MTSGFTLHENVHEANMVAIFQLSHRPQATRIDVQSDVRRPALMRSLSRRNHFCAHPAHNRLWLVLHVPSAQALGGSASSTIPNL
jgi:hypothetical protein